MKRKITFLLLLALVLTLSSCTQLLGSTTQTCTVHKDLNRDSVCDTCGKEIPVNCTNHTDNDHDGKCDTKGCKVELAVFHVDTNHDGICDALECNVAIEVVHTDSNGDAKCDTCGIELEVEEPEDKPCEECSDENGDGKCDKCGEAVEAEKVECEHADANFDGKCDTCKDEVPGAIALVKDGKTDFSFVLANGAGSSALKAMEGLIKELKVNLESTGNYLVTC